MDGYSVRREIYDSQRYNPTSRRSRSPDRPRGCTTTGNGVPRAIHHVPGSNTLLDNNQVRQNQLERTKSLEQSSRNDNNAQASIKSRISSSLYATGVKTLLITNRI